MLNGVFSAALAVLGYKGDKDITMAGNKLIAGIIGFGALPVLRAVCKIREVLNYLKPFSLGSLDSPGINTFAPPRDNNVAMLELIYKPFNIMAVFPRPGTYYSISHEAIIS